MRLFLILFAALLLPFAGAGQTSSAAAPFQPAQLSPTWQLDATADFPRTKAGARVKQWPGTGITSEIQDKAGCRPVYADGALKFDGVDDCLALPMWQGGVGNTWTVAVLLKIGKGIINDRSPFGGDVWAQRVLTFAWHDTGLYTFAAGYSPLVPIDECAMVPNDNWKILIIRSNGTEIKTTLDWYHGSITATPNWTATTGKYYLGSGEPRFGCAPFSLRYMAYFPTCLSDDDAAHMADWLEQKKGTDFPPLTVIYGGGQSNYLASLSTLRRELPAHLDNVVMSCTRQYGASPLNLWMNDTADLTGFEVCPFYDLSAAPADSIAHYIGEAHSGTRILDSWKLRTSQLAKNPQTKKVCLFLQGESDCDDAKARWRPNGDGLYNLRYTDSYWLADTYGRRSAAWNAAVRQETGHEDLVFIYERVAFDPSYPLSPQQVEAGRRQHRAQLDAMAADPRYLVVDTSEFPRVDGVHLSSPDYQKTQVPNTGTERFTRAAIRLIQASDQLAAMSPDARLLAMRAIDCGFTPSKARYKACETLAASADFSSLRSLVIPSLTARNPVDQERLRRCNLLLHLGEAGAAGFTAQTPAMATATYAGSPDPVKLQASLKKFLKAWGVRKRKLALTPAT